MEEQTKVVGVETEQDQTLSGLIQNPTGKQKAKFIIPSVIGVFLFLCPIWVNGNMNIPLGVISEWVAAFIKPWAPQAILGIVVISAIMSLITTLFKPKAIIDGKMLSKLFVTSPIYLVIRIIGAIIATLVFFQVGPEWIYSGDTGGTMMSLMSTLIAWFFAASFLIPLLMDYGIMDYTGTLIRNLLWPLFRLPGRAAVDLCASWVGNCNVGVVLTSTQYEQGYYTARESVLIATCFSAVSLPFCLVIAAMMGVEQYFIPFYLILTFTGIISVVIMARIWPLSKKYPDEYYALTGKQINEVEPKGISKTRWAYLQAVTKAEKGPNFGQLIYKGIDMFLGIIFTLVPVTMCVGTLALVLSTYTPVFDWISMPFGYYLQLLGVEDAFAAAPGTVVGFADMFIPAVICSNIPSIETRFIIGILSLVQIIYMSEVGSIMLASKMPVKITDLIIIFLEKTIIAIPIIVLLTKVFLPF
ncbi:YjiH family protein [Anaerovorax sp. IOR16]|uniref:YjiH family protein n=1 Tax=Anaerovorax sp. IOR16 TaxID=2773458 RepID=UPI0019D1F8DD|nr:YjiH family protein [Anaerovorax sp. IOR16]